MDKMTAGTGQPLSTSPGIDVRGVGKTFRATEILRDISFSVNGGECFGILGENGSGKTTLLKIVTGLVFPDAGTISIAGADPHRDPVGALSRISAMIGIPAFYENLTAKDNLRILWDGASGAGAASLGEALEMVGLEGDAGKKVGAFSRGMLQRLGIAHCLTSGKQFIILDEPTQGVDPAWIEKLQALILRLAGQGKTFIITSHNFDFIMNVCARVLILSGGRNVYMGGLHQVAEFPYYFHLRATPSDKAAAVVRGLDFIHKIIPDGEGLELTLRSEMAPRLVSALVTAGCEVHECAMRHYSVSDLVAQRRENGKVHEI